MAYKEEIAVEVLKLVEIAPPGVTPYKLEQFNQKDVIDTVNALHSKYPDTIRDTYKDYAEYATIEIEKK